MPMHRNDIRIIAHRIVQGGSGGLSPESFWKKTNHGNLMPAWRKTPAEAAVSRNQTMARCPSAALSEIIDFATRYDPQYFHMDPEQARRSIFGEVVASGVHNLAIWRQLDHEITGDIRWICGVAWDDFRWKTALRAGDTVYVTAECLSKRESRSDPRRGVVVYRYTMVNQDGKEIFRVDSTNLVERRSPS